MYSTMEFFGPFFSKVLVGVTSIGKVFVGKFISGSVMDRMGSKGSYYIVSDERGGHVMVFIQFSYDFVHFGSCMVQIGLPNLVFRLVSKVTGFMLFKKGVVVDGQVCWYYWAETGICTQGGNAVVDTVNLSS